MLSCAHAHRLLPTCLTQDFGVAYYIVKYCVKSQVAARLVWSSALFALESCLDFREAKQRKQAHAEGRTFAALQQDAGWTWKEGLAKMMATARGLLSCQMIGAPFAAAFILRGAQARSVACLLSVRPCVLACVVWCGGVTHVRVSVFVTLVSACTCPHEPRASHTRLPLCACALCRLAGSSLRTTSPGSC